MSSLWTTHPGDEYVRKVVDSFEVEGPGGKHLCLALEPLREPVWMLGRRTGPNGLIPPRFLKALLPSVLECLDFLHTKCHIIHTGTSIHTPGLNGSSSPAQMLTGLQI